jgi:deoxyribonucleoside regulator
MAQRPRAGGTPGTQSSGSAVDAQENLALLGRLAWLYYGEHLTQQEIASQLRVSRFVVLRGLKRAAELGLIRVSLDLDSIPVAVNLEGEIVKCFGCARAMVVRKGAGNPMAMAAASYLDSALTPSCVLGVGISRTVAQVPQFLRRQRSSNGCTVVGMSGGALNCSADAMANPTDVSGQIALAIRARVVNLLMPFALESADRRRSVMADVGLSDALRLAQNADLALVGIGQVGPDAFLLHQGCLTDQDMTELESTGAVGDILGRFYREDGTPVPSTFDERIVGVDLDDVRSIPNVVAIAAGAGKVRAILGALNGGYIDSLVTDADTARSVLEASENPLSAPGNARR